VSVRDELNAALEARKELGDEMEPAVISIPLLAIAAVFTGIQGVIAVCVALAVIAIVTAR
jgi:hypothetical protein